MNRREAIKASVVGAAAVAAGVALEPARWTDMDIDGFLAGPVEFIGGYNVLLAEPELVEASWIDTNGKGHWEITRKGAR